MTNREEKKVQKTDEEEQSTIIEVLATENISDIRNAQVHVQAPVHA